MSRVTVPQDNFSAGELSPTIHGRYSLQSYFNGVAWLFNFYCTVQGELRFRSGTKYVGRTRDNKIACLIPFEFNTDQAYILEFTDQKMRIIKDGGIVTQTPQNITAITKANPAVLTYAGTDTFANGDRVLLDSILGMTELNGIEAEVANVNTGANTFELSGINSTAYGTYVSGGTVAEIVEVVTSYLEADLFDVKFAQTNDLMYLVHPDYQPFKLTRSSHTAWTLMTYGIIGNPFGTTKAAPVTITGATAALPCKVTYSGTDPANGNIVYIDNVVGMVELNKKNYTVANVDTGANTFELQGVDSTLYTAYTSGGTFELYTAFSYPGAVGFFEKRLYFAGSDDKPNTLWGSKGGDFDYFTNGVEDDDALTYRIGDANRIRWILGTEDFLAVGTAGAEFKASGGGQNDAITPTNISVKPSSRLGVSNVPPLLLDNQIIYFQRNNLSTRSFEFDITRDGFVSINKNIIANEITRSGIKQAAYQGRNTNIAWCIKNNGQVVGMTFEPREQVTGWHRHSTLGDYESVAKIPQADKPDQVYYVVKRTINGSTVRFIEYTADQPDIPRFEEYFTGTSNKDADEEEHLQALWEAQKRLFYVDAGIEYNGLDYSSQNLTLSAITGASITVTAGGAVFTADMIGREIWGVTGGRALITGYTSATVVTAKVKVAFKSTSQPIGTWYLTAETFSGLGYLEGQEVAILADGGVIEGKVVSNGSVTLDSETSYAVIGLPYFGFIKTMNVEGGGDNGPAQTKEKSVSQLGFRLLDTLGLQAGTDLYKVAELEFRSASDKMSRPPPLFTGVKLTPISDDFSVEKYIYALQTKPQPCNIQLIAKYLETNDG